jgi:hypothetical protein
MAEAEEARRPWRRLMGQGDVVCARSEWGEKRLKRCGEVGKRSEGKAPISGKGNKKETSRLYHPGKRGTFQVKANCGTPPMETSPL